MIAAPPTAMALEATEVGALLMQGRYADAWPLWDARPTRLDSPLAKASFPEWRGEPLAGKSILVWGEQGLGDEIQMVRFVPALRELSASRITLACNPLCVRAFGQLGADAVMSRYGKVAVEKHDYWAMAFSLPRWLGVSLTNIPSKPYLRAQPACCGGVGVAWRGRPENPRDPMRSLPSGDALLSLPGAVELRPQGDVLDSLSQLAGLDLVITVDTSWAHMAGALGKPVWILLPHHGQDWRWLRDRSDSPWYPSARLFRQSMGGDWGEVVDAVRAALTRVDRTSGA